MYTQVMESSWSDKDEIAGEFAAVLNPADPDFEAKSYAVASLHKLRKLRAVTWSTAEEVDVPEAANKPA